MESSRTDTSSSSRTTDDWLEALLATPGLTSLRDPAEVRRVHLDDALRARDLVAGYAGTIVDVGSGGGSPGIPLAHALPDREVVLLEAARRKCSFLERWAPANARVVWGRAEEQPTDWAGVAVARALAHPPTAVEWCVPLVRPGGAVVLWVGESVDREHVARVADRLAASLDDVAGGLLVLRKTGPTPPGFPRRVGVARKRPLP